MSARGRGAALWRMPVAWLGMAVLVGAGGAGAWAFTQPAGEALAVSQEQPAQQAQSAPREGLREQAPTAPRRAANAAALAAQSAGCDRCHSELELLRQQSGSLSRAREILVPAHVVDGSAHGDMSCAECHTNYARYPHEEQRTSTATCASCHQHADSLWSRGAHAHAEETVTCVQCHSSHDIRPAAVLRSEEGAHLANANCTSCHDSDGMAAHEPHAQGVACAACHAAHETRSVDDPDSWLAPGKQMRTCGACHDTIATPWQQRDIHGNVELRREHLAGRAPAAESVTCTSCHVGHQMLAVQDTAFPRVSVQRCAECHEKATRTFFGSYHGKATVLGSQVSAACYNCHGAHDILPDSMPASHVSEARLVETCRQCHENSRPAFVKYDSHPDPFNRARNPWLFYAFFGMNGLLIFVLIVFGGHTILWWVRLWLDKRRGIIHGPGQHGHGGHS